MYSNEEKELYNQLTDSIKKQVEKLDELDVYTSSHIHNVPKIVNKICKKMNFNDQQTKFFIQCAYLHDIGKIFIPLEILQKNTKLTYEEYEIIKTHTTKGAELCEAIPSLRKYSNAARFHHENEDGSGYPKGIKNIPIEAEIVKVADIYDALIEKRQYKEEIEITKAVDILNDLLINKGLINKDIFRALLDVIIENEDITYEEKNYIENIKQKIQ